MIAAALHVQIERYAAVARQSNPLFTKAADGTMTTSTIARYLANVLFLIRHTPLHLTLAADKARSVGNLALAGHFEHKLAEETGHDRWAEKDLLSVARQTSAPPSKGS